MCKWRCVNCIKGWMRIPENYFLIPLFIRPLWLIKFSVAISLTFLYAKGRRWYHIHEKRTTAFCDTLHYFIFSLRAPISQSSKSWGHTSTSAAQHHKLLAMGTALQGQTGRKPWAGQCGLWSGKTSGKWSNVTFRGYFLTKVGPRVRNNLMLTVPCEALWDWWKESIK